MCAMIRVLRVCRCVRVCVLEPHISACFFWLCLLLLTATDTTTMRVWTTAMHVWSQCMRVCVVCVLRVRTATVQLQSHSKFVWNTSMRVLALHIYAYV